MARKPSPLTPRAAVREIGRVTVIRLTAYYLAAGVLLSHERAEVGVRLYRDRPRVPYWDLPHSG